MSDTPTPRVKLSINPGGRAGYVNAVLHLPAGQTFTEQVNVVSSSARERYIKKVTKAYAGIDAEDLAARLDVAAAKAAESGRGVGAGAPPTRESLLAAADEQADAALDAMAEEVRREAEAMLLLRDLLDLIMADIDAIGVVGEQELAGTTYLLGTGRLLPKPASAIVQGTSSSGKSYVVSRTGDLFPDECKLLATDITTNALYYLPPGSLMHKLILGGERRRGHDDERAEITRAMREMVEAGELRKVVPVKNSDGSGMESKVIWQPGPIAFIESTTSTEIFDEDANRCLLLGTDETAEQTARIVAAQARAAARPARDTTAIVQRHHAVQRMLRRVHVIVPYAEIIAAAMPTGRPEARRAMPQIITLVRAVALLHQRQRTPGPLEHGDCIEAAIQDYVIARALLMSPLGRALSGALPDAVARFGQRLTDRYGVEVFDSNRALADDQYLSSKGKVNEYLRSLEAAGVTECVEQGKGPRPAQWRVVGDVPHGGALWLPTVEDLGKVVP